MCWHSHCRLLGNLRVFIRQFLKVNTQAFCLFHALETHKVYGKKMLLDINVLGFSLQLLFRTVFAPINICIPVLVAINKNWNVSTDVTELPSMKFREYPFCDSRVVPFVQADGWNEFNRHPAELRTSLITIKYWKACLKNLIPKLLNHYKLKAEDVRHSRKKTLKRIGFL